MIFGGVKSEKHRPPPSQPFRHVDKQKNRTKTEPSKKAEEVMSLNNQDSNVEGRVTERERERKNGQTHSQTFAAYERIKTREKEKAEKRVTANFAEAMCLIVVISSPYPIHENNPR